MAADLRLPEPLHRGKVRQTYRLDDRPDQLLVITTDRLSLFDVVMPVTVPGKGRVLNRLTEHWLRQTPVGQVMPHHLITTDPAKFPDWAQHCAGRAMIVKQAVMLPYEWVIRGALAGSAWREYQVHGTVHGHKMPSGLSYLEPLPEPMLTPATKAPVGGHDVNLSLDQTAERIGSRLLGTIEDLALEIFRRAAIYAAEHGLVIIDTKLELGHVDGELTLGDEVLTPDSSRFLAAGYDPAHPRWLDKEYTRTWGLGCGWNRQPPPPAVPPAVVRESSARYHEALHHLIG